MTVSVEGNRDGRVPHPLLNGFRMGALRYRKRYRGVAEIVPSEVRPAEPLSRLLPGLRRERRVVWRVAAGVHEHEAIRPGLGALRQLPERRVPFFRVFYRWTGLDPADPAASADAIAQLITEYRRHYYVTAGAAAKWES